MASFQSSPRRIRLGQLSSKSDSNFCPGRPHGCAMLSTGNREKVLTVMYNFRLKNVLFAQEENEDK